MYKFVAGLLTVTFLLSHAASAREMGAAAETEPGIGSAFSATGITLDAKNRPSLTNGENSRANALASFGFGVIGSASTLTHALAGGVKDTVMGTVSLAGPVTTLVSGTIRQTVDGTVLVAGVVGGAVSSTVKSTVSGTAHVAGAVGDIVGGAVRSTVAGTARAAGTVTGIVADTVKYTVSGTVDVAGVVAGGVGATVSGVAKSLLDAPQAMIQYASTLLGTPYRWGGNTAESGLDCSGFVREVVQGTTGKLLPRTAKEMSSRGTQVAFSEMKAGDLVFFNTRRRPFSHVGIYLGDGRFMHGASGAKSGRQVRIDSFDSAYYRSRFNGARRIADQGGGIE